MVNGEGSESIADYTIRYMTNTYIIVTDFTQPTPATTKTTTPCSIPTICCSTHGGNFTTRGSSQVTHNCQHYAVEKMLPKLGT